MHAQDDCVHVSKLDKVQSNLVKFKVLGTRSYISKYRILRNIGGVGVGRGGGGKT